MSEITGAAQQLRGAQVVGAVGQNQQRVREVREDRTEERAAQRDEARQEGEVRAEGQREAATQRAEAQQMQREERAAQAQQEQQQPPATRQQEGRGEVVDTMA